MSGDLYERNYIDHVLIGNVPPIVNYEDETMIVKFPTPNNDKIIQVTRRLMRNCVRDHKPKRAIIDLRGNIGGMFHVFYDALRPLMPNDKNIVTGVAIDGREEFSIDIDKDNIIYTIGQNVIKLKLTKCYKYDIPVTVLVNEKSLSSSQVIAMQFDIIGNSPGDLTNYCVEISKGMSIPMYRLKKNGLLYKGLDITYPPQKPINKPNETFEEKYNQSVVLEKPLWPIDEVKPLSDEHLFSILRYNNTRDCNMHVRTRFTLSRVKPVFKNGVLFMPDFVGFESVGDIDSMSNFEMAKRISIAYKDSWDKISEWVESNENVTIDCRGFRRQGIITVMCFWPFLEHHVVKTDKGDMVLNPVDIKSTEKLGNVLFKCKLTIIVDDLVCRYNEKFNVLVLDYFMNNHKLIGRGPIHNEIKEIFPLNEYKILKKTCTLKRPFIVRSQGSFVHEDAE